MSAEQFTMTAAERDSPLWRRLESHFRDRRDTLRAKNDATQPIEQTECLRGRIAELNALLALSEDRSKRLT